MLSKEIVSKSFDSRKNPFLRKEKVFLSNQMDILLLHFLKEAYSSRGETLRHIVVTPSNAIKDFLIQQITKRLGCLFGLRFLSLPQTMEHLIKLSYEGPHLFPSLISCMLFLESTIKELLLHHTPYEGEVLAPLFEYIGGNEEKILPLAEELSHIFLQYGVYGGEALKKWEALEDWQQLLWAKTKKLFHFPSLILQNPPHPRIPLKLHIFNPSTIPKIYCSFLETLSSSLDICYYFRSPTPHYWGDALSEKAVAFLDQTFAQKELEKKERFSFHALTGDGNFLLSNLAQVAKPLYLWLIEKEEVKEAFYLKEGSTALSLLQQEIYQMLPPAPKEIDASFEVDEAPSLQREVEILLHNLERDIFGMKIPLEEVTVYVVDLEAYYPYIKFLFEKPTSPFGYRITDIKLEKESSYIESLSEFFSFADGRFDGQGLQRMITKEGFAISRFLSEGEYALLCEIIEEEKIRFGYDKANREEILKEEILSERGSWKFAFDTLLDDLPFLSSKIELSSAEGFGHIIEFITTFYLDLERLRKGEKTLSEWTLLLTELIEKYFSFQEETKLILRSFNRLHHLIPLLKGTFSFKTIRKILDEIFQTKATSTRMFNKPVIHFCPLSEGSVVESTLLYVLGFDERSFPRHSKKRSIQAQVDRSPEMADKDRYLFLELLLSAKKKLVFSYTGLSPEDGKPLSPSFLLQQVLKLFPKGVVEKHPPFPFSKYYTTQDYYSEENERLAKAYYAQESPPSSTSIPPPLAEEPPSSCSIKELTLLFRHPLQFYCNTRLGIYLDRDSRAQEEESSEFFLSYLDRSKIPVDLITKKKTPLHLPTALFEKAAQREIDEETLRLSQEFQKFGLSPTQLFTLHFDPAAKKIEHLKENHIIHPPIEIGSFLVYGTLFPVTEKGILAMGEKSMKEIWKHLPHLLLLAHSSLPFGKDLLFLQSGEQIPPPFTDPKKALASALEYYKAARISPSPLMPDRIDPLVKKQKPLSPESFDAAFSFFEDPYLSFLSPNWEGDWKQFLSLVGGTDADV